MNVQEAIKEIARLLTFEEIQMALSGIRRWGGFGPDVYRHSLAVASHYLFRRKDPDIGAFQIALVHDAGEILFGDWARWPFNNGMFDNFIRKVKNEYETIFIKELVDKRRFSEKKLKQIKEIDQYIAKFEYARVIGERFRTLMKPISIKVDNTNFPDGDYLMGVYLSPDIPNLDELMYCQNIFEARRLLAPCYFYATEEDGLIV